MERRPGVPAADPRRAGARWKSEIKNQPEKGQPENHQLNRCARRRSCPPTKRRKTEAREKRGGTKNAIFAKGHSAKTWEDVQGRIDGNSSKAKTHFGAHAFEAHVHHCRAAEKKQTPKWCQPTTNAECKKQCKKNQILQNRENDGNKWKAMEKIKPRRGNRRKRPRRRRICPRTRSRLARPAAAAAS